MNIGLYAGNIADGMKRGDQRRRAKRAENARLFNEFRQQNPNANMGDLSRMAEELTGGSNYQRGILPSREMLSRIADDNARQAEERKRMASFERFQRNRQINDALLQAYDRQVTMTGDPTKAYEQTIAQLPENFQTTARDVLGQQDLTARGQYAMREETARLAQRAQQLGATSDTVEELMPDVPSHIMRGVKANLQSAEQKQQQQEYEARKGGFFQVLDQNAETLARAYATGDQQLVDRFLENAAKRTGLTLDTELRQLAREQVELHGNVAIASNRRKFMEQARDNIEAQASDARKQETDTSLNGKTLDAQLRSSGMTGKDNPQRTAGVAAGVNILETYDFNPLERDTTTIAQQIATLAEEQPEAFEAGPRAIEEAWLNKYGASMEANQRAFQRQLQQSQSALPEEQEVRSYFEETVGDADETIVAIDQIITEAQGGNLSRDELEIMTQDVLQQFTDAVANLRRIQAAANNGAVRGFDRRDLARAQQTIAALQAKLQELGQISAPDQTASQIFQGDANMPGEPVRPMEGPQEPQQPAQSQTQWGPGATPGDTTGRDRLLDLLNQPSQGQQWGPAQQ